LLTACGFVFVLNLCINSSYFPKQHLLAGSRNGESVFLWCKNRSFKHHIHAFQITKILMAMQYMNVSQRCLWRYGITSLFINVPVFLNTTLSKRREPLTQLLRWPMSSV